MSSGCGTFIGWILLRHDARRAGAADRRDIEDGAVLDRLDFRRELVLVAVFLQIAVELDGFDEADDPARSSS